MTLSTTPTIEGHPILAYKGIVTGETIIGANFVRDFFAGIRDIIGGRSGSYEKVLRERLYAHGSSKRNGCCHLMRDGQRNITGRSHGITRAD